MATTTAFFFGGGASCQSLPPNIYTAMVVVMCSAVVQTSLLVALVKCVINCTYEHVATTTTNTSIAKKAEPSVCFRNSADVGCYAGCHNEQPLPASRVGTAHVTFNHIHAPPHAAYLKRHYIRTRVGPEQQVCCSLW